MVGVVETGLPYLPEFRAFGGVRMGALRCDCHLVDVREHIPDITETEGPAELLTLGTLPTRLFCEKEKLMFNAHPSPHPKKKEIGEDLAKQG